MSEVNCNVSVFKGPWKYQVCYKVNITNLDIWRKKLKDGNYKIKVFVNKYIEQKVWQVWIYFQQELNYVYPQLSMKPLNSHHKMGQIITDAG